MQKLFPCFLVVIFTVGGCSDPAIESQDSAVLTPEAAKNALLVMRDLDGELWISPESKDKPIVQIDESRYKFLSLTIDCSKKNFSFEMQCGGLGGKCGTMIERYGWFYRKNGRWIATLDGKDYSETAGVENRPKRVGINWNDR